MCSAYLLKNHQLANLTNTHLDRALTSLIMHAPVCLVYLFSYSMVISKHLIFYLDIILCY